MPETNGESTVYESHIAAKREIRKIHWGYVSFSTTQNRHVRESIGFMQRAERCKIEEICRKQELLKIIGNMCCFWKAGADTICCYNGFSAIPCARKVTTTKDPI